MKFVHLSDLHLGKRLNGYSRMEEQQEILNRILELIQAEQPDAVVIAGDIYDRPVPPEEATALLSTFLMQLHRLDLPVMMISGNHDSAERIAFAAGLLENSRIYISPAYDGNVKRVVLSDAAGEVAFHLLPYIKPTDVRRVWPEEAAEVTDYTSALRVAIRHLDLSAPRNVLAAHLFVTGAARCDSEELSIGGQDNVDAEVFSDFDYVALGHLHGPQNVDAQGRIRYCGTPLMYSVSECHQHKSVTVVSLDSPGNPEVRTIPLPVPRAVLRVEGAFDELLAGLPGMDPDAYLDFVITDEEETPDAVSRLRHRYPHVLSVRYCNSKTRAQESTDLLPAITAEAIDPLSSFEDLFTQQYGRPFSPEQRAYLQQLIDDLRGDGV